MSAIHFDARSHRTRSYPILRQRNDLMATVPVVVCKRLGITSGTDQAAGCPHHPNYDSDSPCTTFKRKMVWSNIHLMPVWYSHSDVARARKLFSGGSPVVATHIIALYTHSRIRRDWHGRRKDQPRPTRDHS